MRPLKFRAWHKPTNRIFDVYGFNRDFVFEDSLDGPNTSPTLPADRADCTMLQWTGLVDIKGVEVYEGDIIVTEFKDSVLPSGVGRVYNEVAFREASFGTVSEHNVADFTAFFMCDLGESSVAGNIFENPDLLEPLPEEDEVSDEYDQFNALPEELQNLFEGAHCHLFGMGEALFEITEFKYEALFPVGVAPVGQKQTQMFVRAASVKPLLHPSTKLCRHNPIPNQPG